MHPKALDNEKRCAQARTLGKPGVVRTGSRVIFQKCLVLFSSFPTYPMLRLCHRFTQSAAINRPCHCCSIVTNHVQPCAYVVHPVSAVFYTNTRLSKQFDQSISLSQHPTSRLRVKLLITYVPPAGRHPPCPAGAIQAEHTSYTVRGTCRDCTWLGGNS